MKGPLAPRRWAKYLLAVAAWQTGFTRRKLCLRDSRHPLICAYHRIADPADSSAAVSAPVFNVSPGHFEAQMRWLARWFELPKPDVNGAFEPRANGKRPRCLVTFDDGWLDNLTSGMPIMNRFGVAPAIFVAAGLIGSQKLYWTQQLWCLLDTPAKELFCTLLLPSPLATIAYGPMERHRKWYGLFDAIMELKPAARRAIVQSIDTSFRVHYPGLAAQRQYLDWSEVSLLVQQGAVIGSHGYSHHPLTALSEGRLARELGSGRKLLNRNLADEITQVAFPHSRYNDIVLSAASDAGYRYAFGGTEIPTVQKCSSTLTLYPRVIVVQRHTSTPWGGFSGAMFGALLARIIK